jgi:3-oxoacyl-[acyl-carrier protein] reductase
MNIVVTGASRGIGYELVKIFAADPANVVYAISRNADKLSELVLACTNQNVQAIVADIAYSMGRQQALIQLKKNCDKLDILIHNAGTLVNKPFEEISEDDLEYIYKVNVFAPFILTQHLLHLLEKGKRSHVVNISSMGGFQGSAKFPGLSAYSSSKAAVAVLSESLAEELKDRNIVVNCLALGAVQTEMLTEAFPGYNAPLNPAQMAQFIAEFAVNGKNYFNGKILPVSLSTP